MMKIENNILLTDHNTFRIPCIATEFVEVTNKEEMAEVMRHIDSTHSPFVVLGYGSNTLFTSDVYRGVVIKNNITFLQTISQMENEVVVEVGAGFVWDDFVSHCVSREWYGVENLSLIPGTVGAAPVQNIGAYGVEVGSCVHSVRVYNRETDSFEDISRGQLGLGYRESIFKKNKNLIIISVTFTLSTIKKFTLSYRGLDTLTNPTIAEVRDRVIEIRKSKLPDMRVTANAGSFFKNPAVSREVFMELQQKYPDIVHYDTRNPDEIKLAASWLIEHIAHAKEWERRAVGVWQDQPLVLVNYGGATGGEVLDFAKRIQNEIKNKTGIDLEIEVNIIKS